ncbi:MAG: ATPase, T2SS/T4P/T4SS family [Candidatus Korarchaeota archaeon]|nr:CpaF/VirB11 family protein [Thermoproteota archaeon]MCR8463353.1 CpaF/VirB11 family protein [Thermoproteota archaeon]MCR8470800.1 CpaF/VirB11 family protein [Thermoproteota archaeon]MCR8472108.1 CpaF/VirB11 family protein [Thermoproteota archaeon]MCR8473503.1 CpaF/VirB11 family protein [Thermoproteota archaeon]
MPENINSYEYNFLFSRYRIEGNKYTCTFDDSYYKKFSLIYTPLLGKLTDDRCRLLLNEDTVIRALRSFITRYKEHFTKGLPIEPAEAEEYVALHVILKLLGVEELFHMLLDPYVNEIYIDGAFKAIYLDHAVLGRLKSEIILSKEQIKNFLLYVKLRSNLVLDFSVNPVRFDISFFKQRLRISVMPQKVEDDLAVNIRKLIAVPPYISFIHDAVSRYYIALLSTLLIMRPNIVIFGETGSGKTTLASLLIHVAPRYWRIALIEDISEIQPQILQNKHAIRVKALSLEEKASGVDGLRKDIAILEMLHRTPDLCFISEVHDKDDTKAMFHAMASGLRTIATTHARSIESLLERWFSIYRFPQSWFQLIDLIVHLRRVLREDRITRLIDAIYIPYNNSGLGNVAESVLEKMQSIVDFSPLRIKNLHIIRIRFTQVKDAIECHADFVRFIANILRTKSHDLELSIDMNLDKILPQTFKEVATKLNNFAEFLRPIAMGSSDFLMQETIQVIQQWIEEITRILEVCN